MSKPEAARSDDLAGVLSLDELAALLPHYKFLGFLAEGGMGAVYLARQVALNRPVAIKILPRDWGSKEEFARHFEFEAQALASLSHPGIIAVHDFGTTDAGHAYLVMEYVEGRTLHRLIRDHVVTPSSARDLALQLCEAVAHAHQHGILHRDLKPRNIMVDQAGCVKVMDFGLARPAAAAVEMAPLGTPGYAAPELSVDGALVDHRSDIYSLGVVVHEMLTGSRIDAERLPLSAYGEFEHGWEEVILKATAEAPEERFATVEEMGEAVWLIGMQDTAAGPDRAARPRGTEAPPRRSMRWLHSTLALLACAGVALWWGGNEGDAREKNASHLPVADAQAIVRQKSPVSSAVGTAKPLPPQAVADGPPGHVFMIRDAHRARIRDLALMPDEVSVASCSDDGSVVLWDLRERRKKRSFSVGGVRFLHVASSKSGGWLAAAGDDGRVCVWSTAESGNARVEAQFPGVTISGLAFLRDESGILVPTKDAAQPLVIWDWRHGTRKSLAGWDHAVDSLTLLDGDARDAFVTAGDLQAGGSPTRQIRLGSIPLRRVLQPLPMLHAFAGRVHLAPDGATAVVMAEDRLAMVDLPSGTLLSSASAQSSPTAGGEFVDDGRLLLTCGTGGGVRLHEVLTAREVWVDHGTDAGEATAVVVSRDARFAVSAQAAKGFTLHVWRLPGLDGLQSPEARHIGRHAELLALPACDAGLASFVSACTSEWEKKVVQGAVAAALDVDTRYLAALRHGLSQCTAQARPAWQAEILRTGRGEAPPLFPQSGWPENLARLFHDFMEQRRQLPTLAQERREAVVSGQASRINALRLQRIAAGDEPGAARVALLGEKLDLLHGEMDWVKLQAAIRASVPGAAFKRAVGWIVRDHRVEPAGPAIPPVEEKPVRLQRPAEGGRLVAWKRGLSAGPMEDVLSDHLPEIQDAVSVSAGTNHALAVRSDGTVVAWGMRTETEAAMVPPGLDRVVAVAAGLRFDLALREDGSVVAWSPRMLYAMPPDMKPAISIHNGVTWGFARHADGSLTRLPPGDAALPEGGPVDRLGLAADVAVGFSTTLVLTPDGKLIVRGKAGDTTALAPLLQAGGNDVVSVACNHHEAAVLRRDGGLIVLGEAWRVAKLNGRRFPGADRILRCWPAGAFAVHFPGDHWEITGTSPADSSIGPQAEGCHELAVGQFCVVGIRR